MIHAICDFCGKDCDRTAALLSMTPFQNFARYHTDNEPYGNREKTRSFVICYECCKKHNLPNPYETYSGITKQEGHYEKCLDNYTDVDLVEDKKYDKILAEFKEYVDAAQGVMTKMIIETCFLTKEEIVTATKLVCEAGIDWVKTSTGQYGGPSVQDVMLMVDAVKGTKTKVKVAGVKDPRPQNAFCFIQAGAELIGTRAAVEILDAVDDLRKIGLIPAYTGDK